MSPMMKSPYGYSKMYDQDPDERMHRRAQFLIQKTIVLADMERKPSFMRVRFSRMKVKIGTSLKKLRKSLLLSLSAARAGTRKQVLSQIKSLKHLFCQRENVVSLPPLLI